jgi:hypothetical protein
MASYYLNLDNWNSMDYDQRQAANEESFNCLLILHGWRLSP